MPSFTGRLGTDESQPGNIQSGAEGSWSTDGAFQADAFQSDAFQAEPNLSFTADAVLLKTTSVTFTADALLADIAVIFTADSVLFKEISGSFTANSVIKVTVSATTTADAVLVATVSGTFTSNAVLLEVATFTANAWLVNTLIYDTFTRTTSVGNIGTPDLGKYAYIPGEPFQGNADGTALVVDPVGYNYVRIAPTNTSVRIRFDYLITDEDGFGDYEIATGSRYSGSGTNDWLTWVYVRENGAGDWVLGGGINNEYTFTPARFDTWTVEAVIDLRSGGYFRAKTWKLGDPEPANWQIDVAHTEFSLFSATFGYQSNYLYEQAGETDAAWMDNLLIQQIELATPNDWFLADASLLKIQSSTFTANSVLFKTASSTFTADSVLATATGTVQAGLTADAVLAANTLNWTFTANAFIATTSAQTFTANGRLVVQTSATFTANAWLRGTIAFTFTANAVLLRPATADVGQTTRLHKSITLHVAQRRPVALSTYLPPRNPSDQEQTEGPGTGDLPCLPPCPGYPGGFGSPYGANGAVLRRTVYYCDSCAVFVYTHNNEMGIGTGTTSGHPGCEASHSRPLHESRIFADYSAMPVTDVGMTAKLLWAGGAPSTAGIKVFANVPDMPPLSDDGDFVAWSSAFEQDYWTSGNYIGTLTFVATDSDTTTIAGSVQWCDIASSLTVSPESLMSDIFRFEIADLSVYYGAEFRAPNVTVTVGT